LYLCSRIAGSPPQDRSSTTSPIDQGEETLPKSVFPRKHNEPPAGLQAFSGSVSALFCVWFSPVAIPHGKCGANLHPGRAEQLCIMLGPEFG
jgi:hypothetical protein